MTVVFSTMQCPPLTVACSKVITKPHKDTSQNHSLWVQELSLAVGACFDMDPDQAPQEALSHLDDLASQVDSLAGRRSMLQACQQQFGVPQTDLQDPRELSG